MRLTRILAATLLLLSAQLLCAQVPAPDPAPVELEYPNIPKLVTARVAIHADDEPAPPGLALTPIQEAMHTQDRIFDNMVSVALDVVINQNGRVESVHATGGPQRFYAQAEEIAMHRAYSPARVGGEIVRARFQDYVSVYPKERWATQPVAFPAEPDLGSVSISLERTGCLGSCPGYTVIIAGSGEISFTSCDDCFVAVPGTHHAHIPRQTVVDLIGRFRSANFLSTLDAYSCNWTDMPSETLTLTVNGTQKKVFDYGGSFVGLPDAVEALEAAVDDAAGTARWTVGTADTLPSLQAEHWNFSSPSAENIGLFDSAIEHRNAELVHAFLAAKTPITITDPKVLSPLCAASGKGDRDLIQQMLTLHPKVKLPVEVTDECLSLGAQSGSVPVVQLWLSRGVRTNFPPEPDDDSADDASSVRRQINPPLLAAIQSGNPDVVDLLLHAHADVSSKANNKRALLTFALHNARNDAEQALDRILSLLIEAGADVNEETDQDRPAIFEIDEHPNALPLLLKAGASVDQRDSEGKTPLMLNGFFEDAIAALLKAGADPTLKAPDGTTPLSAASQANCKTCIALIEDALKKRQAAAQATPLAP